MEEVVYEAVGRATSFHNHHLRLDYSYDTVAATAGSHHSSAAEAAVVVDSLHANFADSDDTFFKKKLIL